MLAAIQDDFDLEKIITCGQCFRAKRLPDGAYRFISGRQVLTLRPMGQNNFAIDCDKAIWQNFWFDYFDLGRDYRALRRAAAQQNEFAAKAICCGQGLRVLRQEPWEMLITFIISQRKSIPAIAGAVERLAQTFGERLAVPAGAGTGAGESAAEALFAFPTPQALAAATAEQLAACGLGYRTPYIMDAAQKAVSGELDMAALEKLNDDELFERLLQLRGVGKKVANCVCLFGYGRCARAPVDVWIARAIEQECGGKDPFPAFGQTAGLIQQYVFYYMKNRP